MAPSTRRKSRMRSASPKALGKVNIYCARCDNQLGIFDNAWIRLTTSYARPAHPGTCFGTDVTQKTQVVPNGASQPALQGCTLAEVSCKKCSTTVGQFCKAASTQEQECLIDEYFFRLSKTYLKDIQTNERTEPISAVGQEITQARASSTARPSLTSATPVAAPRLSHTLSRALDTPTQSQPQSEQQLGPSYQHSELRNGLNTGPPDDSMSLQMKLQSQEERLADHNTRLQQQDTQIRLLTSLVNSLRETVEEMKTSLQELQSSRLVFSTGLLDNSKHINPQQPTAEATKQAQLEIEEVGHLRAENAALKAKLDSIASVVGVSTTTTSQTQALAGPPNPMSQTVLGKRKCNDRVVGTGASQLPESDPEDDAPSLQVLASQADDPYGIGRSQDVLPGSKAVSEDQSEVARPKVMPQSKKSRTEHGPSYDRGSAARAEASQLRRNNRVIVDEDVLTASGLTNPLHEASDEELEHSNSALLTPTTHRPLPTTVLGPSIQNGDHQAISSMRAGTPEADRNEAGASLSAVVPGIVTDVTKPALIRSSIGNNVEFSDDDQVDESYQRTENVEAPCQGPPQHAQDSTENDASERLVQSRRTRGKTATESAQSRRGVAHPTTEHESATGIVEMCLSGSTQDTADIVFSGRKPWYEKTLSTGKETGDGSPMGADIRVTRKQQRAEELRRRDELAKQALEMDD